jgi:hypothetical protein
MKRRATVPGVPAIGIEDVGVSAEAVDVLPSNAEREAGVDALLGIVVLAPPAAADALRRETAAATVDKAAVISDAAKAIADEIAIATVVRGRNRHRRLLASRSPSSRIIARWRPWRT